MESTSPTTQKAANSSTRRNFPLTAEGSRLWRLTSEGKAHQARLDKAAEVMRERLSSMPFYAKRAKEEEEATGDPLAYWRDCPGVFAAMEPLPEANKT